MTPARNGNKREVSAEPVTTPYHCTAQVGPHGPQVGLSIDDPTASGWRGDFVGDQPSSWADAEPVEDAEDRERQLLVTILTGDLEQHCAHASMEGDGEGTAWLHGREPFAVAWSES